MTPYLLTVALFTIYLACVLERKSPKSEFGDIFKSVRDFELAREQARKR
jgi:hypothetical protein